MQIAGTPNQRLYVHRGTERKIGIALRDRVFNYHVFDSTVKMQVTPRIGSTFFLTVGSGVTLGIYEGLSNAIAYFRFTLTQSRLILTGNSADYEIQIDDDGYEKVILMGNLNGIGGNNPDG